MNVFKLKTAFAVSAITLSLGVVSAHAEGLYVGGAVGTPHFGDGVNGIAGEGSGLSGKIFGGYQLSQNFAIEGGAASLGHIDNASGTVHGNAFYLDAVGLLPLGANVSLLGSVGAARVSLDTSNGDDKGLGVKLGLGAEYALSRSVALRGAYENYRAAEFGSHPNVGQYTLGVRVGF